MRIDRFAFGAVLFAFIACGGSQTSDVGSSTTDAGTSGSSGDADGSTGTDSGSSGSSGTSGTTQVGSFSFFVTSYKSLQALSGSVNGFGGDLRYGETGAGSGLRGADKICSAIAEKSLAGSGTKAWRAFLSAKADANGVQVNAIDRIGNGPWYDRLGRLFAMTKADVMADRPAGDAAVKNDFPNEDGVPNHAPDPTAGAVDNHDMLTGTGTDGKLFDATATCLDWTGGTGNLATEGKPRVGHSWPRGGGGGGGPGGGPGGGSGDNWMSALTESGCAPGVNLVEQGGPIAGQVTVGSGGGYGGFYCFVAGN